MPLLLLMRGVAAEPAAAEAALVDHIERIGDSLSLRISDNGVGVPNEPKRSGGLSNMMWRAVELGGSCTVAPNDPAGTRLLWNVPV